MSSYKIIKNSHVSYAEKGVDFSALKFNESIQDNKIVDEASEIMPETTADIEQIKDEIRRKLFLENEQEKQALINEAIREANEEAKKEAEKLKKEATEEGYKVGFKQGYHKGIEDCKDECNEIKKSALGLISQAELQVKEYFTENQTNIVKLAGDMAESIIHKTIDLSSENILMLIKPIIDRNERNEIIIINCHPDNYVFLKKNQAQLETAAPNARFVILSENNLEKNGCIIENENQIIDLQIRKQLNSIIKDILSLEG